jgi:DNA helicase II / ATP-dependent DNA helicase PcrA
MTAKKHPDYKEEIERLEYTIDYIKTTLRATADYKNLYRENIRDAMKNLDDTDASQNYISIMLNTKFLEVAERNLDALARAKNKPYFARMDFRSKGSDKTEKLYIGKTSLFRAEDDIPLIIDWRSRIANLYYESRLGEVSYKTEVGEEEGELFLKRQYSIEEGKLENILDIDITTNDTFLQASLEANADNRLKDIASTIQAEQNRVIRAAMSKPLIVQGVAGSGKTTIALHRIAYFIYTYERTFDPDNFMIIAPNNLFINYISEVLPELGVEKVKQTTFIDFMGELIENEYNIVPPNEKLIKLVSGKDKEENEYIKWSSSFKGSLEFRDIIDNYVNLIESNFVPDMDFALENKILMSKKSIRNMFLNDLKYLPFYKRIDEIKKTLSTRLKSIKKDVLHNIEAKYEEETDYIFDNMPEGDERRLKIISLLDEKEKRLKTIQNTMKTLVKKYIASFPKLDLFDYYRELLTVENLIRYSNDNLPEDKINYLCKLSNDLLNEKKMELEDYAPLVYLKHRIFGFRDKIKINSVVIDEAQDFSLFQFYTLKTVLNTNKFTILGDTSQGIHSYRGINNWEDVLNRVFDDVNSNYNTLVQSYRTTIEVMNLANEIIKKLDNEGTVLAKPVIRHGQKPQSHSFEKEYELVKSLEEKIKEQKNEGYKSIAVVCKTMEECKKLKKLFDKNKIIDTKIINEKDESYEAGIVIIPSYLAKGLEFDTVFITNLEEQYIMEDLDIKLLYVAVTRAMHKVYIYYKEGTMPILNNIGTNFYERNGI